MDQGILTIHFNQATAQAIQLVSALENVSSRRVQLLQNLNHTYDQILFYLKDSFYVVLREHIPSLVRELIAFWDVWGRYLDPQYGFVAIQEDVDSGKIAKSFVLLETLSRRVKVLLVERQLERDFRAHFSNRLAA